MHGNVGRRRQSRRRFGPVKSLLSCCVVVVVGVGLFVRTGWRGRRSALVSTSLGSAARARILVDSPRMISSGSGGGDDGGFDAIIVPAGGQTPEGPPDHVVQRLDKAVELSKLHPRAFIITTARGTPHKPCPTDEAGFERPEAADNARYLIEKGGVDPGRILEETSSLETVGNAYLARVIHADVRGLRRLAVVNNGFHMPRTRAVFEHVFSVSNEPGGDAGYRLTFFEVPDALPPDVLRARLERESKALPKFDVGGEWREKTPTLAALHDWVFTENTAYASKRLMEKREVVDPEALKSY